MTRKYSGARNFSTRNTFISMDIERAHISHNQPYDVHSYDTDNIIYY